MSSKLNFTTFNDRINASGKWVYIAPVSGVVLTNSVNNEFQIKRSLLVSRDKLPYIRRRLGIQNRISEYAKEELYRDFFSLGKTFAVTWLSGTPEIVRKECRRIINDELSILSLSQLGFSKRRYGAYPVLQLENHIAHVEEFIHESEDKRTGWSGHLTGKLEDLELDDLWRNFHKEFFFLKLLKVINSDIKVSRKWRKAIERTAILVGQGLCSTNLAQSFLWNMIALEILLKEHDDKFVDEFPKRAEAFLGWVGFWETDDFSQRIQELYGKRCDLVHEGKRDQISIEDLLFTDDLIFNLLLNIIHHINIFSSKNKVVEFSKKVEAEYLLGGKPKVRPKTFKFLSRNYSERDKEEI